jgi:hypothetical protein
MALLLILFALLSFVFAGVGSGSSGTSFQRVPSSASRSCSTVVASANGKTVRKHSCTSPSSGGTSVHLRAVVRCSARMTAGGKTSTRCLPPAKP